MVNTKFLNLTNPQKSVWLTEQYHKNTCISNVCGTLTINQEINKELLEKAISMFISSNDSLNIKLDLSSDEPRQYISNMGNMANNANDVNKTIKTNGVNNNIEDNKTNMANFNIQYIEVSNEKELNKILADFTEKQFNLDNELLYDFILFKYKNEPKGGFTAKLHHLISDAWSMTLLIDEIIEIYDALLSNNEPNTDFPSYLEYIKSEQEYLNSDKYNQNKAFWNELFNVAPELTSLSKSNSNEESINSTKAKRKVFTLSENETETIKDFCKTYKTSPYSLFMAVMGIYTGKINNTNSVIIGTPILNRKNFKEKHTMGMFISTIPFKMDIDFNNSFANFLDCVGKNQLSYFKNQRYPYDDLLKDIRDKFNITNNLYTTVLSYQNAKDNRKSSNISYNTVWHFNGNISEELELHISDLDDNNTFNLIFDYNVSKFNEQDIIELKNRFIYMVKQVLDKPQIMLKDIEIVTPDEKSNILTTLNNTEKSYPQDKNVFEIFYGNVVKYPNKTAVVYENESITYENLYKKVCGIEIELLNNDANFQEIIAIYMPKSIDYVASILAVLKIGAIYLPISYDYPLNRINYMLENSKTKLVLCKEPDNTVFDIPMIFTSRITGDNIKCDGNIGYDSDLTDNDEKAELLDCKNTPSLQDKNCENTPSLGSKNCENAPSLQNKFAISSSAYVIYTSGSTGEPKGVEVSHKALINHVYAIYDRFDKEISYNDTTLSIANTSFDANVQEIFIPLFFGCTLHLVSDDSIYEPKKLANYIADNDITFTFIPPTILNEVYNNLKDFNNLKLNKLLVGVQAIKNTVLNKYLKLLPNLKIHNGYGPTEATICCISKMYNNIVDNKIFNVPIGKPMNNCEIYILNNGLTLQPMGYVGEICVSGDCLSKGYLYNKEKTDNSFVYCKDIDKKIYRTGDYGFYLPNGDISYVGRIDMQVKLNGYRIELSEIDEVIQKFSHDITNSISLIHNDKIYTFLVANNIDTISLKQYLRGNLPYYMIPIKFINIDKLPSTKNGKIDKANLINILDINIANDNKTIVLPSNETEEKLVEIFASVLDMPKEEISIKDNFFEIGGDSLSAIKICTLIQKELEKELSIKQLFDLYSIQDIANYLLEEENSIKYEITKCNDILDKYPISSAQKRVYLSSEMAKGDKLLYNMPGIIQLPKDIDVKKLEVALNNLIAIHDSLRTYFVKDKTGIYQKVLPDLTIDLKETYLDKEYLENYISNFPKEFDLSTAPLLRCEVLHIDNAENYLLIDMHHIISDGVSTSILVKDLTNLYNGISVAKSEISYADYSVWENNAISNNLFDKEKDFWKNELKDTEILNLSLDFPRPTATTYTGSKYKNSISEDLLDKIKAFCNEQNITQYMFLFGAFNILMYNFCRQENITIGTPIANRNLGKVSDVIGMFVNTLAIHTKIDPSQNIKDFFEDFKINVVNCFDNQIYPFNELTNDLKMKNLVNTMFTYQNTGVPKIKFGDFETSIEPIFTSISKFDLSIELTPNDNHLDVIFEYCTDLFRLSTIESLFKAYVAILDYIVNNSVADNESLGNYTIDNENVCVSDNGNMKDTAISNCNSNTGVDNCSIKISDIELLNNEERNNILCNFNNTSTNYPKDTDIYSLFLEQVEKTPDNMAIFFEDTSFTYKELNEKVCTLADSMKNNGVSQNDIVAILVDKSIEAVIAMFATLKLGSAYLPIDTDYPTERINFMLVDSKAKLLLTTNDFVNKTTVIIGTLNIALDNTVIYNQTSNTGNSEIIKTTTPAYIMYTSGSTGKPKGTIIKQVNIIRLVKNTNFIKFSKKDKIIQTGSIVFDACTFEIFGALLNGLPLYIIKKEDLLNASNLQDYILKHHITIMWLTAPLFNQLSEINPHMFSGVKYLLSGGDTLSPKHINMVRNANPNLTIINGYGPTENTTFSCCFTIDKTYKHNIPIGKPIANSTAYIVSKSNKLLPVGFPGELWAGGDGVALGYLNNPTLTSERFIDNPFGNDTIYKTGDLVKWLSDGNIEFLGRIDSQVKINGFRVELNEINLKLTSYPDIKEAYTLVANINNKKHICSYITSETEVDISHIKEYLKTLLPKYMIPSYIIKLDIMPLNTNGKVDKNRLPSPIVKEDVNREIVFPKNELEKTLLAIFEKVLNRQNISTTDDFFEIGGDSLSAMKLQVEAMSNNIKIEYSDIFTNSTIVSLANIIDKKNETSTENSNNISTTDEERYLSYNSLLKSNNIDNVKNLNYESLGNVLLTGFTGFLGAHILDSFLKKENGNIYCLIRDKENVPALQRLKNTLNFYFEDRYDKFIGNRIQLINGDITLENLGLSLKDYEKLGKNIQTVIHSAALVKHYGTYKEFENINIVGTKNIVDFCSNYDLKLIHISTISVSGNVLAEESNVKNNFTEDKFYDETNFYIEQNIENLYVNSKFKGEDIVLNAISKGLKGYICRMGNLTSRYSEGKFQQNHFENAFVNRFKSILQIGYAPDYLLTGYVEFTPIDYCADAIIDLASHYNRDYSVFHLLNDNHVPMTRLCKELDTIGIPIKIVSSEKFKEIITDLLKNENTKNYLQGIINDFDENQELSYESNVKIKSEFTKKVLKEIGFEWPYIDTNYLRNYFKYLSDIGYFNIKI